MTACSLATTCMPTSSTSSSPFELTQPWFHTPRSIFMIINELIFNAMQCSFFLLQFIYISRLYKIYKLFQEQEAKFKMTGSEIHCFPHKTKYVI
jgi:hypothetical protein